MKIDLLDITFLIPVRIDSIFRIENLLAIVNFLNFFFNTKIIVLEAASYDNSLLSSLLATKADYYFLEDKDPIFYKTKYLNIMTSMVKTPFLSLWDADIVVPKNQIIDSLMKLRTYEYDVSFPYNGKCWSVSKIIRICYLTDILDIEFLENNRNKMCQMYQGDMYGGAIFLNTEKYICAGKENEKFYGWGPEDAERYFRWKNLKYNIYRNEGDLFHLYHPRDMNGMFRSKDYESKVCGELSTIMNSSYDEILDII